MRRSSESYELKPRRHRDTVTADEVIAHFKAKPQWNRSGARTSHLQVAVRSIGIAINEICGESTSRWGGKNG